MRGWRIPWNGEEEEALRVELEADRHERLARPQLDDLKQQAQKLMLAAKKEVEDARKREEQEKLDSLAMQHFLPDIKSIVNEAEDEVEKALITHEMIANAEEDSKLHAVEMTEAACARAQQALDGVRASLKAKRSELPQLDSSAPRGELELQRLEKHLQAAQLKLKPLKAARNESRPCKRLEGFLNMKMIEEVEEKIILAEVELDRLDALLKTEGPLNEVLFAEMHAALKSSADAQEAFTKLCNQISELRANAFLKEAGDSVASVEHRAEEMKASSSRWSEEELGPAELREATEQSFGLESGAAGRPWLSLKIEREVTNSMAEARKLIACRQIEARNKTASPNLAVGLEKLQHRLMQVQAEVANQRKLFAVAEQPRKGRKAKEEVAQKLGELEPILLEAEKAAVTWPVQTWKASAEQKLHEMQVNFKPLARLLESAKADDCHLRALQARSEAALTKLKCYIQSLLSEVKLRLTNCKAAVEEAEEAPKSDSTDAVEMAKALATWDRKIQAVLTSISTGRSEMSMKRLALQRLNSSATSEALEALSSAIGEMEGWGFEPGFVDQSTHRRMIVSINLRLV
eukprot:g8183.t1